MLSYFFKCRKNTENKDPKVVRTKTGGIMLLSKCAVCDSEKLKYIEDQEASELLSSLGRHLSVKFLYHVLFSFRDINKSLQDIKWMKQLTSFY